jgi:hypothetical protein
MAEYRSSDSRADIVSLHCERVGTICKCYRYLMHNASVSNLTVISYPARFCPPCRATFSSHSLSLIRDTAVCTCICSLRRLVAIFDQASLPVTLWVCYYALKHHQSQRTVMYKAPLISKDWLWLVTSFEYCFTVLAHDFTYSSDLSQSCLNGSQSQACSYTRRQYHGRYWERCNSCVP